MAMPIRGGILTCNIADTQTLHSSYLSFVTHGGIFVPSTRQHNLGEDVFVAFTLPGSAERSMAKSYGLTKKAHLASLLVLACSLVPTPTA